MNGSRRNIEGDGSPAPETLDWFLNTITDKPYVSNGESTDWLPPSPDRTQAAEGVEVQRLWNALGARAVAERLAVPGPADPFDGSLRIGTTEKPKQPSRKATRTTKLLALAACGAMLAATGVLRYVPEYYNRFIIPELIQTYATESTRPRIVDLPDGSRMTLGAQTVASVHYTPSRRIIVLERGEALFRVAHNRLRPFVVLAGAGSITAIGTQFDVRREFDSNTDRVTVTVKEGTVEVGPPKTTEAIPAPDIVRDRPLWTPARLVKGQELSYDTAGPKGQVANVDVDSAAAWVDGRLEYGDTPLRIVIPRVSRYSPKPIVLADDAAGDLPFSGTVFEGQINEWLRALQTVYPVEITESPQAIVIHSRRDPAGP
jgi:transmembrane sensor